MRNHIKFIPFLLLSFLIGCNTTGQPDRVVRIDEIQTKLAPKIPAAQITLLLVPFSSFPGNAADILSDQLIIEAKGSKINLSRSSRIQTTHSIEGQISALGGDNGNVVVYAFDVNVLLLCNESLENGNSIQCKVYNNDDVSIICKGLGKGRNSADCMISEEDKNWSRCKITNIKKDSVNCRVFRINGQEIAGGTSGDPWAGVQSDTLYRISIKVISELKAWISRAPKELNT